MPRFTVVLTLWLAIHAVDAEAVIAQEARPTAQARVEASLASFIEACRAGELVTAARHVVYRGDDRTREWRDTANPESPEELVAVRGLCREVITSDPERAGYAVRGFEMETESEGVWHVLVVRYVGSGEEVLYAFLEIDGVLAIGDID